MWAMRKERPDIGQATFMTLVLRKVLALTVRMFIRLATMITGMELTPVLVTVAIMPAVFGLEAMTYMFIPLAVSVQFLVVRSVVRLRCTSMKWNPAPLPTLRQMGRTVLLGTLKMLLMLRLLSE